jgi:hypothetical protein
MVSSVEGEMTVKVAPSAASRHSPPMSSWVGTSGTGGAAEGSDWIVLIEDDPIGNRW